MPTSSSVLVTGTSSGIGRATVERLAADSRQVFAGLRDPDASPFGSAKWVTTLRLDVTDPAQIEAAVARIAERTGGTLDGVVHSAGIPIGGALEEVEAEELRRIFEVNVIAPILLTQKLLPLLRRSGGRVVLVGSIGGRLALPFGGPYHATKFALEGIADSLRLELRPQGVGVALIEPGTISTPIWTKAIDQVEAMRRRLDPEGKALYDSRLAEFQERLRSADEGGEDPSEVAKKILEALDDGGTRYQVGRGIGTFAKLRPLIPDGLLDRVVGTRLG